MTAAYTGLRAGELFGLRWCDVDLQAPRLRVYINYLRTKLERDPHAPELIVTEPGVGYRLADDPTTKF